MATPTLLAVFHLLGISCVFQTLWFQFPYGVGELQTGGKQPHRPRYIFLAGGERRFQVLRSLWRNAACYGQRKVWNVIESDSLVRPFL